MYSAAGKSHSSRCLMVSTAVMTLFRAKLSATTVAATMQPVLNVVFCAKASKGDKSGILWVRVGCRLVQVYVICQGGSLALLARIGVFGLCMEPVWGWMACY